MSYTPTAYKVMIASPGDIIKERDIIRDVIADWNSAHSEARNIVLMPIGWETHSVPDTGRRPQAIINDQLKGCDILIGVFWTRIGTQTADYNSGTIEEIEKHIKTGKPAMLYFSNSPVKMDSIDQEQYKKLVDFKKLLKDRSLYHSYDSIEEFEKILSKHIQLKMNQPEYLVFPNGTKGLDETRESVIPNLTAEALTLLLEASKDSYGVILMTEDSEGFGVQTNEHSFDGDNPRERANWESAMKELETKELIEAQGYERQSFKVTSRGYDAAEKFNDEKEERKSQLLSNEAKFLLKAMSENIRGIANLVPIGNGGLNIHVGIKAIKSTNSARESVFWESVFEELEREGLIQVQDDKRRTFKITKKGYSEADLVQ